MAWPPRGHRAHTAPLLTSRTSCGTITSPRAVSFHSHKFSIIGFLQRLLRMTVSRVRRLSASGVAHAAPPSPPSRPPRRSRVWTAPPWFFLGLRFSSEADDSLGKSDG